MSNRHLYKAKRTDNGEWVEGNLITDEQNKDKCFIGYVFGTNDDGTPHDFDIAPVDPSTICQCTGYKGIWENDIFQCDDERYMIVFSDADLTWNAESIFSSESIELGEFCSSEIEVIGNVFDNLELLEVGE